MSVYLLARGSARGWSDISGEMTSEEADWIAKRGGYQMVSKRLMQAISAEAIDWELYRQSARKPE